MKGSRSELQGKSFLWAFVLCIALFSASAFWGKALGLDASLAAVLLAVAGFIPFLVQATTGYALDGLWVARFSRTEHPTRFWVSLLLSLAVAGWFSFAAYSMYVQRGAA
jgi:hypothetical protein